MSIILFLHQTFREWPLWKMHQYTRRGLEDTFSPETISIARNLQHRYFQPPDTFSPETLSVSTISALRTVETLSAPRNFQPRETFSLEKLSASRNFQSWEQLRHFQPRETFCLEKLSASKKFQPGKIFNPFFLNGAYSLFAIGLLVLENWNQKFLNSLKDELQHEIKYYLRML